MLKQLLFATLFILLKISAFAQLKSFEDKILRNDSSNALFPREKIYVHIDRPTYKLSDTLWLKGYVLSAIDNFPSDTNGIVYLETINEQNVVVKRISAPSFFGNFFSNIALKHADYKQGNYTLRAYTNWMRNFGDSLFFERPFTIIDPSSSQWNTRIKELRFSNDHFIFRAGVTAQNGKPLSYGIVSVKLKQKNKNILNLSARTDTNGNLYLDTLLKSTVYDKDLVLEIDDAKGMHWQAPVQATNSDLIDLQFLPEGGSFIAGKHQQLGFKAVNAFGKGVDIKGIIKDSKGKQVSNFRSGFKGMGVVSFTPELNESYSAILDDGKIFKLPAATSSGTLLQITNNPLSDSIQVRIDVSNDLLGRIFYFTADARGTNCARGRVNSLTKPYILNLAKHIFPSGVIRCTLYDEQFNPLNERITFVWHGDELKLSLTSNKSSFVKKDSVSLTILAKNIRNENIQGCFSMAVVDSSQVKTAMDAENLLSYMLLSSDLKGNLEDPYHYFRNQGNEDLEALMLTQGWVQYQFKFPSIPFTTEKEFIIRGKVTNVLNKPVGNTNITLFARQGKKSSFVLDTLTNKDGSFLFHRFPDFFTDSVSMVIKALNKKRKEFGMGIELDAPVYPAYYYSSRASSDKNILLDTVAKRYVEKYIENTEQTKRDGKYLQEIIVTAKLRIPGSKNLNPDGGYDQIITEEILEKTPKQNLLNILETQVKGFKTGFTRGMFQYMIDFATVRIIIDGVDLEDFYIPSNYRVTREGKAVPSERTPKEDKLEFVKSYLVRYAAENVKGIEIMKFQRNYASYRFKYLDLEEMMGSSDEFVFLEITTITGAGPFLNKIPGEYMYKPIVPVISKQFYSPKYTSPKEKTIFPDLRATIYWNPNIITSEKGEANVSFYTSESNSNYIIILQGTDFKGGLGFLYQPLYINDENGPNDH